MKLNPGFLVALAVGLFAGLGVAGVILDLSACGAGTPTAKTVATDAVNASETAWLLAATACQASPTPEIKTKCASVLLPARTALLAAALDVDQGGANYGCELAQVSAALSFVTSLGVTLPQGVKDAQALLVAVPCTVSDGATLEAGGTGTGPVPSSLLPPANLTGALDGGAGPVSSPLLPPANLTGALQKDAK